MIANLTRGAKTASLHLPADRFQIAGVLSYLGVDRLDDYDIPCEGQDSSGIMVSLEPTGIAERNIAELCRSEKVSLGRLNSNFRSLFKLPYEQQLDVMDRIASQKPEHFDDFRKAIDAATVPSVRQLYSREGIMIESTTRLSNIAQRYDAGKQYPELLISNYDTYEEGVLARQLTLFDDLEESEKILKEHKIIWKSNVK